MVKFGNMSKKDFLVVFNDGGTRIEKDPSYIALHKNDENVLLNPEIPEGSSPSDWIKNGNKIDVNINSQPEKFWRYSKKDDIIQNLEMNLKDANNTIKNLQKNIKNKKYIIITLSIVIIGFVCQRLL